MTVVKLSELMGKEVINLGNGSRIGIINECELSFDEQSGKINALILPIKCLFNFFVLWYMSVI